MMHTGKTIAAIATAAGEGGIAIVRVSGDLAKKIWSGCFCRADGHSRLPAHAKMVFGHVRDAAGNEIDEAMTVLFYAPRSYTREDVLEIQCHGGKISAALILARVIELGALPADPGEFTYRAFLNGRIDLSEAEAVMQVIGANSLAAHRAAVRQLEGGVCSFIKKVKDILTDQLALIDACTDFPEEVEEADVSVRVRERISFVREELLAHADARRARLLREGISVVIVGRPNVGKSSVMNALLNAERAIVTDIPGTTRDILTENITLNGVAMQLSDTAGQRETADTVEKIGVDRARRAEAEADVVLLILDASQPLTQADNEMIARADERYLLLDNKADIAIRHTAGAYPVSAQTGQGVNQILPMVRQKASNGENLENQMILERHIQAAHAAANALSHVLTAIDSGVFLDCAAVDLEEALNLLSEITGENSVDTVIDKVFAQFCVGK